MPLDPSVPHLEFVVGAGIVLREPGREQVIPMPGDAADQMCADLDARGHHAEAARHRQALQVLRAVAERTASRRRESGEAS